MAGPGLAAHQKNASRWGASITLSDESGLQMAPARRTSLAPRGHTPVLPQQGAHHQKVSIAGALVRWPGSGRGRLIYETYVDQYVDGYLYNEFLRQVIHQVRGPMILVHDQGRNHQGVWLEDLQEDFPWLIVEPLPAYAPELNPMEAVWNFLGDKQLVNYAPANVLDLDEAIHDQLRPLVHDQGRLRSFFAGSQLTWEGFVSKLM